MADREGLNFQSEYFARAVDSVNTVGSKEYQEKAVDVLKVIHNLAAENMQVFKSKKFPGVEEAVTRVSALDIIKRCGNAELKSSAEKAEVAEKEVRMLFSSKPMQQSFPFEADGSPTTAFDIAMEGIETNIREVVTSLKKGKPIDKQWLIVGSPVVPGGKVTQEFVEEMRNGNAFQVLAELKTEMAKRELGEPNTRVILTGHSYGADMALTTAKAIETEFPELANRVRVLADDPIRGEKAVKGAILAGVSELWTRRKDMVAKVWITNELKKVLHSKGISMDDNEEQKTLKSEAFKIMERDFKAGNDHYRNEDSYPENIQVYVRQGVFDETDPSLQRKENWDEFLAGEEKRADESGYYRPEDRHDKTGPMSLKPLYHNKANVRVWGYGGKHAIDRFRHADRFVKTAKILMGEAD